jgi:hypothetical protein
MEPQWLYTQLTIVAERLGIALLKTNLKHEKPPVKSGICKIGRRYIVITDRQDPIEKRIDLLASCLKLHDLNHVYLLPKIRDFLDRQ